MQKRGIDVLRRYPILRFLFSLTVGILIAYYFNPNIGLLYTGAGICTCLILLHGLLPRHKKITLNRFTGLFYCLVFVFAGSIVTYLNTGNNRSDWVERHYSPGMPVMVSLEENPVEKEKSYKVSAAINAVYTGTEWLKVTGKMLVYIRKDPSKLNLSYGDKLIIQKELLPITNSGNPGAFDYKQYCALQGVVYQSFIATNDYVLLPDKNTVFYKSILIAGREKTLAILRAAIKNPDELGVAEALLIGYRDDLDKTLTQAYSNTGVVHIIAISGLHLGLIYGLMVLLFRPFANRRYIKIIKPVIILIVLWAFSFIAGAAPSILRSTVMFSIIVLGETGNKRSDVYNSLATAAFAIFIFNPFSLWDVGFLLSYAAVLSIAFFSGPIKRLFYFNNKLMRSIWDLNAVTLSAQILTLPIVLYYFHQFPILFLSANIIAIPLSTFILYGELLLLVLWWVPGLGDWVGKITEWMLWFMNDFISRINSIPFCVWQPISINTLQAYTLYGVLGCLAWWLLQKKIKGLLWALSLLAVVLGIRCYDFYRKEEQFKMIVYNTPKLSAVDLIDGRRCLFTGDSSLKTDLIMQSFYLKPSGILYRTMESAELNRIAYRNGIIYTENKHVFIISEPMFPNPDISKIKADAVIISKNAQMSMAALIQIFDCNEYIFDSSNSLWKIKKWKKEADSLHLRHHSVPEQGAFIMEL